MSLISNIYICNVSLIIFVLKEVSYKKKNDSFFLLTKTYSKRFLIFEAWYISSFHKTETFYEQIFSSVTTFPVIVHRCTVKLCSMQYQFFL